MPATIMQARSAHHCVVMRAVARLAINPDDAVARAMIATLDNPAQPGRTPMDDTYEIITGDAEQNLFTEPGPNHRSYQASDGNWYTGVSSYDSAYACSDECLAALMAGDITVAKDDLPYDERMVVAAVTVIPQTEGKFVDLTAYEIDPDEINEQYLPAMCGHCEKVIRPASPEEDDE